MGSRASAGVNERRFASYLLLPRPQDLVKALIAPMAYLAAVLGAGDLHRLAQFTALWLILETLVYPARYQWNDVPGAAHDREHPARDLRGRLPLGNGDAVGRRRVVASLAVAGARLAAAVTLGVMAGVGEGVLVLMLAVLAIAVPYETLRARRPREVRRIAGANEIALWIVVGFGYAVRGGLGLALAGLDGDHLAMAEGLLFFSAAGTMYVLLSWSLEASNFCAFDGQRWRVSEMLRSKPNISTLVRHLDGSRTGEPPFFTTTPEAISHETAGYLGVSRVLDTGSAARLPWNVALLVGGAVAGPFGMQLAGSESWTGGAAAVIASLGGAAWLCRSGTPPGRRVAIATVAAVLVAAAIATNGSWPWASAFPWLAITWCYTALRSSSYLDSMSLPTTVGGRRHVQAGLHR